MLSDAVHQMYNRARWALLLRGLISLVLGIFILWRPLESVAAFALLIAIWSLVSGVQQMVGAIEARGILPHWWLLLLGGLVSIAFGVAALYYYPVLSLTFAVVLVSYWLLLTGALSVYAGMLERQMGAPWGWTVAIGILSVVAGLYAIAAPPVTLAAIMGLIAGFAIIAGVMLLTAFFHLGSAASRLTGAAKAASA